MTLSNGTATAAVDYDATPIVVNFASGDSAPKTVTFAIVNDTLVEGNETVNLSLGNPTGTTIGTPNTAIFTIVDDDPLSSPGANLSAASIVGDSITDFGLASAMTPTKSAMSGKMGFPCRVAIPILRTTISPRLVLVMP